ncbi:hypothetical protein CC1G_03034 [Coprinopsis cinerea okayama7|uniref:Uncharacterized protein n=1 Tax=Coprinopsis cinerea (strain Okayama-7 / 130 / ATCC MYA-4618 / FGSC 9003) TaxID=240176 RepID=A8NS60_COPC7|nr:hypothetical protein CC1G_03034 [Coprinopsis cinerea okayama7\|eukprot:XP_001835946.2 hypothetical protein CC1G_03034 [Coprinopsis cinerea okayama7\
MSSHILNQPHYLTTYVDHEKRLKDDMTNLLKKVLAENPGIKHDDAIRKVQELMLQNNPYVPPKDGRCIINELPVELLAYIFRVGVWLQEEGSDDDFEEVTSLEERKGFQEELTRVREEGKKGSGEGDKMEEDKPEAVIEVVDDDGNDDEWEDEPSEHSSDGSETGSEDDEGDEEEEEEEEVPFQILVSHVCRQWRETALNTPRLWRRISVAGPPKWDLYEAYLQRSKGQPLIIEIDGSIPEDFDADDHPDHPDYVEYSDPNWGPDERPEGPPPFLSSKQVRRAFDMIIPHVDRWYDVDIVLGQHDDMHELLQRIAALPGAPMLEYLHLHDEDLCDNYGVEVDEDEEPIEWHLESPTLPFSGNAPRLLGVSLWGVHVDWDRAVSLFQNLTHLNLAILFKRPSWKTFATYLKNSPQLESLELDNAGPSLENGGLLPVVPATPATGLPSAYYTPATAVPPEASEENPWEWPHYPLEVSSIRHVSLANHEPYYAHALATKLFFPNIKTLTLDYENGDFNDIVDVYTTHLRGTSTRRSMFQLLEDFTIKSLGSVSEEKVDAMIGSLSELQSLSLGIPVTYDLEVPGKIWEKMVENAKTVKTLVKSAEEAKAKEPSSPQKPQAARSPVAGPSTQPLSIVPPDPSAPLPSTLPAAPSTPTPAPEVHPNLLFPRLKHLETRDISSADVREFVELRKEIGAPLKRLAMHRDSDIRTRDERWFRSNLEEFDIFSDSDYTDVEDFDDEDLDFDEDVEEWEPDEDDGDDDGPDEDDEWEDYSGDDDDDDDMADEDGGGGRIQRARGIPRVSGQGAVGSSTTTGLSELD